MGLGSNQRAILKGVAFISNRFAVHRSFYQIKDDETTVWVACRSWSSVTRHPYYVLQTIPFPLMVAFLSTWPLRSLVTMVREVFLSSICQEVSFSASGRPVCIAYATKKWILPSLVIIVSIISRSSDRSTSLMVSRKISKMTWKLPWK